MSLEEQSAATYDENRNASAGASAGALAGASAHSTTIRGVYVNILGYDDIQQEMPDIQTAMDVQVDLDEQLRCDYIEDGRQLAREQLRTVHRSELVASLMQPP